MKYLLDTNIIFELIAKQPNKKVLDFIESLDESKIFLSAITIGEIKSGIEKLPNGEKKTKLNNWLLNELLTRFKNRIFDINYHVMLTWGDINQRSRKNGYTLPIMDSLIASTCLTNNLTLITRNIKDFENLEIKLINPFN